MQYGRRLRHLQLLTARIPRIRGNEIIRKRGGAATGSTSFSVAGKWKNGTIVTIYLLLSLRPYAMPMHCAARPRATRKSKTKDLFHCFYYSIYN